MAFPFLQRGNLTELARQLSLGAETPSISLENLVAGIDNLRHDVSLSPRFSETVRAYIYRQLARHGNVEDMAAEPMSVSSGMFRSAPVSPAQQPVKAVDHAEYRRLLAELSIVALNRAKAEN